MEPKIGQPGWKDPRWSVLYVNCTACGQRNGIIPEMNLPMWHCLKCNAENFP